MADPLKAKRGSGAPLWAQQLGLGTASESQQRSSTMKVVSWALCAALYALGFFIVGAIQGNDDLLRLGLLSTFVGAVVVAGTVALMAFYQRYQARGPVT